MTDLIGVAVDWLASTGAPNWLVIVAILTHPAYWAKQFKQRAGPVLDKYLPGGE